MSSPLGWGKGCWILDKELQEIGLSQVLIWGINIEIKSIMDYGSFESTGFKLVNYDMSFRSS